MVDNWSKYLTLMQNVISRGGGYIGTLYHVLNFSVNLKFVNNKVYYFKKQKKLKKKNVLNKCQLSLLLLLDLILAKRIGFVLCFYIFIVCFSVSDYKRSMNLQIKHYLIPLPVREKRFRKLCKVND